MSINDIAQKRNLFQKMGFGTPQSKPSPLGNAAPAAPQPPKAPAPPPPKPTKPGCGSCSRRKK